MPVLPTNPPQLGSGTSSDPYIIENTSQQFFVPYRGSQGRVYFRYAMLERKYLEIKALGSIAKMGMLNGSKWIYNDGGKWGDRFPSVQALMSGSVTMRVEYVPVGGTVAELNLYTEQEIADRVVESDSPEISLAEEAVAKTHFLKSLKDTSVTFIKKHLYPKVIAKKYDMLYYVRAAYSSYRYIPEIISEEDNLHDFKYFRSGSGSLYTVTDPLDLVLGSRFSLLASVYGYYARMYQRVHLVDKEGRALLEVYVKNTLTLAL